MVTIIISIMPKETRPDTFGLGDLFVMVRSEETDIVAGWYACVLVLGEEFSISFTLIVTNRLLNTRLLKRRERKGIKLRTSHQFPSQYRSRIDYLVRRGGEEEAEEGEEEEEEETSVRVINLTGCACDELII